MHLGGVHHKRTKSLESTNQYWINSDSKAHRNFTELLVRENSTSPTIGTTTTSFSPIFKSSSSSDLTMEKKNSTAIGNGQSDSIIDIGNSITNNSMNGNALDEHQQYHHHHHHHHHIQANDSLSTSTFSNYISSFFAYFFTRKNLKTKLLLLLVVISIVFLFYMGNMPRLPNIFDNSRRSAESSANSDELVLVRPTQTDSNEFTLYAVADRDTFSYNKVERVWKSVLIQGILRRTYREDGTYTYSVSWTKQNDLKGKMVEGERGMELSELKIWNEKLYSFDDRTGIVYQIVDGKHVIAKHVLTDGNGRNTPKGFKSEWATVKDGKLWVGSIGKEWTTPQGEIVNYNPMWIKIIDSSGAIDNRNWVSNYQAIQKALGVPYPGYVIHEAVEWSDYHRKWFLLPRRMSKESYDDSQDIYRGTNKIIIANEDFSDIEIRTVGTITPTRGFSSFKFIPDRPHEIVALKSEEIDDKMQSFITVFTIDGKILLPETKVAEEKLEGLEIV